MLWLVHSAGDFRTKYTALLAVAMHGSVTHASRTWHEIEGTQTEPDA
jgi:hypothetical protein